jgi:calcineurin-like phosphoesterase family protein
MEKIGNIFFTSDTHFHHKNIVRGISEWLLDENKGPASFERTRDFNTLEEHDEAIISSINAIIKENDTLYHLGDWSFGGHEQIKRFRNKINCKNIHLIFGNHDQHITPINSPYRQLFSSCDYYKELNLKIDCQKSGKYGKQMICLSHYAMRVWNKSHKGSIMLYGHSHGTLPEFGKSMDVGVDTNNLYPYHLDEILEIMKNRSTVIVDHHNINTN